MIERKILLAFIRIHILYHATHDTHGIYGSEMITELKKHGYSISPGTLYPILHNMNTNGLLTYSKKIVNGKQRKIYTATEKGKHTLDKLITFIQELSKEVIDHSNSSN
jgi:DNA-binding PadR family transcriptional regulator